jgi:transposase
LSLSVKTLGGWIAAQRKGTLAKVGKTQKPQTELEAELARVKRELATVTMERDILKKATVYFAKESR